MYYFIVNPSSRSGRGKAVWQIVEGILEQEQVEYRVFFTSYRYHATKLAKEITSQGEKLTLVTVGGDGTVNEVVDGICDFTKITFAYIPTGSSNDFARSLKLPSTPEAALQNVLHPSYFRKIDLGLISYSSYSRRFAGSCGCGFDAAVCQEALASPIKNMLNRFGLGKLTYVGIALKQILLFRPAPVRLTLDQHKKLYFPRTYFLSALNCTYEGGGLKMCPKARADDGFLDVCVVEGLSKLIIALMFPTAYFGRHTIFRGIHLYRTKTLEICPEKPFPFHADGEPYTPEDVLTISCLPNALTIIAGNP
ncbi:diacylglycerol kinase family protein [Candidatus Merdisoma sp. JLR.KK006]|uniref:diacylglycerol/lipid kinase family protein n=1 Tax=Candidatus Merdisoma sp. JLR.KK006 TaxID=3112626 RepID=UPI002FEF2078